MNNKIILIVEFSDIKKLQKFYNLEFKNLQKINNNNILINYQKTSNNNISLIINKELKYSTNNITQNNLQKIFNLISKTKNLEKKINPLTVCYLPNNYSSQHCFSDSTHQTCCLLGYKARKYSNESGNPIGSASEKLFKQYFGRKPNKYDLTPWCTCIGSGVCSYYSSKFDDGTHIKFINSRKNKFLAYHINNKCESKLAKEFEYVFHYTPGILNNINKNNKNNNIKCSYKKYNIN